MSMHANAFSKHDDFAYINLIYQATMRAKFIANVCIQHTALCEGIYEARHFVQQQQKTFFSAFHRLQSVCLHAVVRWTGCVCVCVCVFICTSECVIVFVFDSFVCLHSN